MKFIWLISLIALSAQATTDLSKRPPSFNTPSSKAVFADFTNAYYEITYNISTKSAQVISHIDLETAEAGQIVFDSLQEPSLVVIDGQTTSAQLVPTPNKETLVRTVNKIVPAGKHHLQVNLPLNPELTEYTPTGVKSAFWMGDLTDRNYLEKYLPTNFVYDLVPMTFHVKFLGGDINQQIYTNGNLTRISSREFKVTFDKNLNISCPYFHTTPTGSFAERRFKIRSIDGRELPATIYILPTDAGRLPGLESLTVAYIDELEKDYGPFLHKSLTIYINGSSGGMEYAGATITSEKALGHELFHSYFARGVMPADGNSGWIDEALAKWRDNGYQSIPTLEGSSKIAALGTYARLTDRMAYSFGERFMSLLNNKFAHKGGLKPFLRKLLEDKAFDPIYVSDLIKAMNRYYGTDVAPLFKKYVMGQGMTLNTSLKSMFEKEDEHHQLSSSELKKLL